jgi:co-chaperonin GroES (HSP10)
MDSVTLQRTPGWRGVKGPVASNLSGFRATGYRVLLLEDQVEKTTESGIVLPSKAVEKEEMAQVEATVIEIGPDAWADKSTDYCAVGDRVIIGQYTGKFHTSPVDGKTYRFLADLDIITPVERL